MSTAPVSLPVEQLGARPFSFHPPIRNLRHNQWRCRRATWAELVAVNTVTGEEICVPRSFLGDVSIDFSSVVVGLLQELEWEAGTISHHCPVIEFPANSATTPPVRRTGSAPVVSIRLEPRAQVRGGRKIGVAIMLGAVACAVGADIVWSAQTYGRVSALPLSRSYRQLKTGDDYSSIVRKLGPPAEDRVVNSEDGRVYRILGYPGRHFVAVLSGPTRDKAVYAGALDLRGRVLAGNDASSLLRSSP